MNSNILTDSLNIVDDLELPWFIDNLLNLGIQLLFTYAWSFVNTLQLLLYLPLLANQFPANVRFFYSVLFPLANLELIPPEYSSLLIFEVSADLDFPFSDSLEEMGFETHNLILNMGSLFVFLFMYTCGLGVLLVLHFIKHKYDFLHKIYNKMKEYLIWSAFLFLLDQNSL